MPSPKKLIVGELTKLYQKRQIELQSNKRAVQIDAIVRNWCLNKGLQNDEVGISREDEEGIPLGMRNISKGQDREDTRFPGQVGIMLSGNIGWD